MSWASRHALLARAVNHSLGGVPVVWGAISGEAILEQNAELVVNGQVISVDYMLHNLASAQFGNLMYGDEVVVENVTYHVRELMRVGDGRYCVASLARLDPGTSAVGRNPREGMRLDDLIDVDVADSQAGEALKFDGSQWVDARDEGTAFVFTQSSAAAVWTINHNLGFIPSVEVFDSGSQEVDAEIAHPSSNTTIIVFTVPLAGFARLI